MNKGNLCAKTDCGRRVLRGGSWNNNNNNCRLSNRNNNNPDNRNNNNGFRVVQYSTVQKHCQNLFSKICCIECALRGIVQHSFPVYAASQYAKNKNRSGSISSFSEGSTRTTYFKLLSQPPFILPISVNFSIKKEYFLELYSPRS